jgi:hypothetical protein
MTISCAIDGDDAAWWWTSSMRQLIYDKNRGKRCCSCAPIFVKLYEMNVEMDLGHSNLHDLLGEFESLYGPNKEFKLKLPIYKEGGWI